MEKNKNHDVGHLVLRIALGLLFLVPGISKLMNPGGITGMLGGLGFPIAPVFAWIVILSEIIFGITLLIGYKTKYTSWPLLIILVVATLLVGVPGIDMANPMTVMSVLWHIVGIAGLVLVILSGPGKYKV